MLIDDSWILKEKARIASRNSSSREAYTPLNIPSEEIPQFPIPFSNKSSVRSPRTISQSLSQQSIKSHAKEVVNSEFSHGKGFSFGNDSKYGKYEQLVPGPGTYNPKQLDRASSPGVKIGTSTRPEHFVKETSAGNLYSPNLMEVQLARALEDSLQREVELKSQCDQLLATLKDLIPEEESPKPNKKQFKNPIQSASPSRRLDSEFLTQTQAERLHAKLVAGDLEEASKTWKKVGYSPLASTDIKTNFEFLKEVAKYRDITIGRLESELRVKSKQKKTDQLVEELNQKNNEIDVLRSTLMSKDNTDRDNYSVERYQYEIQEKENDIRELLLEYEKLQNSYDQLKAEFWQSDKEIIHLREQLTKKSQELRSLHESSTSDSKFATLQISDLKSHSELEPLIKSYSETLAHSSYLDSQLKLLRSQKYTVDFVDLLKQSIPYEDAINLNKILIDQFNFKVSEQINNLQPHFIQLLKSNIEIISKEKITKESEIVILNIEINKLKSLLEIESQIESDIKQFIKDKSSPEYWKKIKRDHVRRVEKVYQAQIDELHDCIKDLNANVKDVTQENGNLKVRNEENVKEITSKLKREHETKKQLADLFAKEKLAHEKTKQFLNDKMTSESDSLGSKLKDAQAALESSNKKIFELENEVQMYISLIQDHETQTQGIQTQVNELENSKQKLYSEITRLNKKIQEIVSVNQRDVQELNDKLFEKMEAIEKEKSVNTDKEEKIAQLEKENQNLKREIYDQDYKIKSKENDADNLKKLQKEIKNLKDHIRSNELDLQDKAKLESNLKEHQNKLRVYEDTVKQLKSDLRKITTELQETQNDLAASRRLQESENQRKSLSDHIQISEASKYKELQSKFNSLISDFQNLKNQFAELSEDRNLLFAENTDLIQKNKQQELENNCLKRDMDTKIVEVSRQIKKNDKEFKNLLDQITAKENLIYKLQERNERLENDARDKAFLGSLNEKVEDLEKRYEMLESSQKKLLEDIKLKYMDWCRSTTGSNIQRISPSFYRSTDTTKEISLFIDAFFTEAKSMIAQEYRNNLIEIHDQPLSVPPSDFTSMIDYPQETNEDFIEKANTLLDRLEKIPENKAKIQVIRLLQENVNLKHEMLDKQNKAHMDEEIFKQLKDVRGINEWVLQKWRDCEKDILRLRKQLLESTRDLESKIEQEEGTNKIIEQAKTRIDALEIALRNLKEFENQGISSETEDLKRTLRELSKEKREINKSLNAYEQEYAQWKSSLCDLYERVKIILNLRKDIKDTQNPNLIAQTILSHIEDYKRSIKADSSIWPEKETEYINNLNAQILDNKKLLKTIEEYEAQNLILNEKLRKTEEAIKKSEKTIFDNYQRGRQCGISEGRQIERAELESENKHLQRLIQDYKESKSILQKRLQNQNYHISENPQNSQDIIKAFYEEKEVREDLERELNHKCDLIEGLLKDLETKRRFMQNREYEYQELLTLKDEELLRLRYQLAQEMTTKE